MRDFLTLSGKLLLALPGMGDPRFDHAVIAMVAHDSAGALGIGVGRERPGLGLHELLDDLEIDPGSAPDCPILDGGPVEPQRGFVLHSPDWQGPGTLMAGGLCAMSASVEVLRAIAAGRGPGRYLIALGYAGWGEGQLEGELSRHGWQVLEGAPAILYDTPAHERWAASWRGAGVDPGSLMAQTGRA